MTSFRGALSVIALPSRPHQETCKRFVILMLICIGRRKMPDNGLLVSLEGARSWHSASMHSMAIRSRSTVTIASVSVLGPPQVESV